MSNLIAITVMIGLTIICLFLLCMLMIKCFYTLVHYHDMLQTERVKVVALEEKTLEKAVYSQSSENTTSNSSVLSSNDEDVLTRHLLKLSEIEQQFQQLTNKFEEINFKIDKLSSRLSKVQADNQLRFQELEVGNPNNVVTSKSDKTLPGSSQPQDLGAITYKDTETQDLVQKTQSIETTSSRLRPAAA